MDEIEIKQCPSISLDKSSLNGMKKLLACFKLFSKAKNDEINDEIIVLTGKYEDVHNIFSQTIGQNYKVMNIENYDKHDLMNLNTNIILTASNGIPFNIIKNSDKKFLMIDAGPRGHIDCIMHAVDNYEKFNIKNKTSYSTYTQKRNPIDLIYKDAQTIFECFSIVLDSSVSNIRVQKDSISFFRGLSDEQIFQWKQRVIKDIDLLVEQKLLTFKLARVIYIIASLNDYVSDEEVYSFYQNNLGNLKYSNINKEVWEVSHAR